VRGQKLICQGQTLTNLSGSDDPTQISLAQLKIMHGSKIMVLGRKVDPEQDAAYQKILDIEKRTLDIREKFNELCKQVHDIENGHLAKDHVQVALRDLEKRSKSCSESWMKALESLDGIHLDESQTLARNKRKSVINSTNYHMDQAEDILNRINKLKA